RLGRGGFPVSVQPLHGQSIWIEVYCSKGLPAGIYLGQVAVDADGVKRQVPIELELFDFTLPDRNTMDAMIYYEGLQPTMYHGRNLDTEYHRFAHRQRIELVHGYDIETANAARDLFNGQA